MSNLSTFSSNTRYLASVVGLVILCVVLYVGAIMVTAGVPPRESGVYWTSYFLREKRALADNIAPPRVIIYGSSSSFFGIRASKIASITGLPAVNMATHGGNGAAYTFAQALAESQPGDIAIILIDASTLISRNTYLSAHGTKTSYALDMEILKQSPISSWPEILSHISWEDIWYAIRHLGESYVVQSTGYWRFKMGESGDIEIPFGVPNDRAIDHTSGLPKTFLDRLARTQRQTTNQHRYRIPNLIRREWKRDISPETLEGAKRLVERIRAKGAHVFLGVPPSVFDVSVQFRNDLEAIAEDNAEVLNVPAGMSLELMFDTAFHANARGSILSTARLAVSLCEKIDCPNKSEAEDIIDNHQRFMAITKPLNFAKVTKYNSADGPKKVRRVYGPEASFSVYAPTGCTTEIVVRGNSAAESATLTVSVDEDAIKRVGFPGSKEVNFSFQVPPSSKNRRVGWSFDKWRGSGRSKLTLQMTKMKKVVVC